MNVPRYRAWRFVLPDFDAANLPAGLALDHSGHVDLVDDERAIRQAILLLLSTRPGERVMRPGYGCLLHRLLFYPNDLTTAGLAIYYVRHALELWEARIEVVRVDADPDIDRPTHLNINLEYRVRATQRRDTLVLSMNLLGEGSTP